MAGFLNGAAGDVNSIVAVSAPPDWNAVAAIGARMHGAVAALLPTLRDEPAVRIAARTGRVALPLGEPEWAMVEQVLAGYDHSPREGERPYYLTGVASERFERAWAEAMQEWRARPDGDRLTVELQAVKVGPLALVAVPAEVFSLYGFALKQRSPFRLTALVGFANNSVGYVARPRDFDDAGFGGYAALKAPRILGLPPFARHAGEALVDACLELLRSLEE